MGRIDLKSRLREAEDRAERPVRWALLTMALVPLLGFSAGVISRPPDMWMVAVGAGWFFWLRELRPMLGATPA